MFNFIAALIISKYFKFCPLLVPTHCSMHLLSRIVWQLSWKKAGANKNTRLSFDGCWEPREETNKSETVFAIVLLNSLLNLVCCEMTNTLEWKRVDTLLHLIQLKNKQTKNTQTNKHTNKHTHLKEEEEEDGRLLIGAQNWALVHTYFDLKRVTTKCHTYSGTCASIVVHSLHCSNPYLRHSQLTHGPPEHSSWDPVKGILWVYTS